MQHWHEASLSKCKNVKWAEVNEILGAVFNDCIYSESPFSLYFIYFLSPQDGGVGLILKFHLHRLPQKPWRFIGEATTRHQHQQVRKKKQIKWRIHRHLDTLCFLLNWSSFVWDKEQCDLFVFALPVIKELWLCVPASPTMILNHISILELATECFFFFWCCCVVWTDSDSPADGASEPLNFAAVGSCGRPEDRLHVSLNDKQTNYTQMMTNTRYEK